VIVDVNDNNDLELEMDRIIEQLNHTISLTHTDPLDGQYSYVHYTDIRQNAAVTLDQTLIVIRSPHQSQVHVHSPNERGVC
jgi:hypothetical protein